MLILCTNHSHAHLQISVGILNNMTLRVKESINCFVWGEDVSQLFLQCISDKLGQAFVAMADHHNSIGCTHKENIQFMQLATEWDKSVS
jgi:hypothetical protein